MFSADEAPAKRFAAGKALMEKHAKEGREHHNLLFVQVTIIRYTVDTVIFATL